MQELFKNDGSLEELCELDIEFHRLLGKACHNTMAHQIYDFVITFLQDSIRSTYEDTSRGKVNTHYEIMEAIRNRDGDMIEGAAETAISWWEKLRKQ